MIMLLHNGDQFPTLSINVGGQETLTVPDYFADGYGVVLLFRGAWCPYCNAQLRAFERASGALADVSARVVALSADDEGNTNRLIAKHRLRFPVGRGVDAREVAARTGAFLNEEPSYLQSTGFVLDRSGQVLVSVYSSGAIGRLVPDEVIGLLRHLSKNSARTSA
jgi:peroxiredoxin